MVNVFFIHGDAAATDGFFFGVRLPQVPLLPSLGYVLRPGFGWFFPLTKFASEFSRQVFQLQTTASLAFALH